MAVSMLVDMLEDATFGKAELEPFWLKGIIRVGCKEYW